MNNYGQSSPNGFLPDAPSSEDIFKSIMGGGKGEPKGWAGINSGAAARDVVDARRNAADDLKRMYAQFAATEGGKRIIEDILNQTLRRGCSHPDAAAGIEQEALFSRERKGQNMMAIYILTMIVQGRELPAPGKKKPSKKKS